MKIVLVLAVCMFAMTVFGRDNHIVKAPVSTPGMVNTNPGLDRAIREATSKAEELMFVYRQKLRQAKNQEEIDQADRFYDREVIPAEVKKFKSISLKYSFEYKGLVTPSSINLIGP